MTMRVVLVGLVAALGVTTPSPTQCSQWWLSIRSIGSAVLADWDHWKPQEENRVEVAFHLPPVAARSQSTEGEAGVPVAADPVSSLIVQASGTSGERLVAAHHVRYRKPEEVASREEPESWPDLPRDVFENPSLVNVKDGSATVAAAPAKRKPGSGTVPPASPNVADTIKKEPPAEPSRLGDLQSGDPPSLAGLVVPIGRSENLEASLFAALLESAEEVRHGNRETAPVSAPAAEATPSPAEVVSGNAKAPAGNKCRLSLREGTIFRGAKDDARASYSQPVPQSLGLPREDLTDFDWADFVALASVPPLQADPASADDEAAASIPDSDTDFDAAENPNVISWADATGYDREEGGAGPNSGSSLKSTGPNAPAMSADLKQAVQLTRDAFNAWMNLVRRGSTFKLSKR